MTPETTNLTGPQSEQPATATSPTLKRLLPWPSDGGNPCYLVSGSEDGYLWRLADDMEAEQLATGIDVLDASRKVLDDTMSPYAEVRYAGIRLAECLTDVLRVAESRGMRLPVTDTEDDDASAAAPASTGATGSRMNTGTGKPQANPKTTRPKSNQPKTTPKKTVQKRTERKRTDPENGT